MRCYAFQVIIDDMNMGTVFQFPCNRWFALDEDDGRISRELILGIGPQDASPGKLFLKIIVRAQIPNVMFCSIESINICLLKNFSYILT